MHSMNPFAVAFTLLLVGQAQLATCHLNQMRRDTNNGSLIDFQMISGRSASLALAAQYITPSLSPDLPLNLSTIAPSCQPKCSPLVDAYNVRSGSGLLSLNIYDHGQPCFNDNATHTACVCTNKIASLWGPCEFCIMNASPLGDEAKRSANISVQCECLLRYSQTPVYLTEHTAWAFRCEAKHHPVATPQLAETSTIDPNSGAMANVARQLVFVVAVALVSGLVSIL
jgi:hypothetical protein